MFELLILTIITIASLITCIFLLGFRLGGTSAEAELTKVRLEAAQAEKQIHNLARQVFIAMAEQVELRQRPTSEPVPRDGREEC